jgi:hypothetical protein
MARGDRNFRGGVTMEQDMVYTSPIAIPPTEILVKNLANIVGGHHDLNVDGSSTPQSFRYTVPAGKVFIWSRSVIHISDTNVEYHNFAGLGTTLTNGIGVYIKDTNDAILTNFMNGEMLNATVQFAHLAASDFERVQSGIGVDPDLLVLRWSLSKSGFVPYLTAGQYVEFLIQDDLTGLDEFHVVVQGRLVDAP